ncbi:hypothetical protein ON010_g12340 [Phytophthora cinnamomi]|nr:hypothetical protein ON010_g12340 [Phytophthora cinnamomi]
MSEHAAGDAMKLRLKLKLPRSMSVSSVAEEAQKQLLIGARGGVAVKELLSTAPNIEVAIRDFQAAHGVAEAHAQLFVRKKEKRKDKPTTFAPRGAAAGPAAGAALQRVPVAAGADEEGDAAAHCRPAAERAAPRARADLPIH